MIIVDTTEEPAIAETEISGNSDSSTSKPMDQSDDPNRTTEGLPQERENPDFDLREEEGDAEERENPNPEFWHGVLLHRYDYEVERTNSLKSQSTFILGAIGLISTLLITIYTTYYQIPVTYNVILAIIIFIFLGAGYFACKVFVAVHRWEYCVAYPSDEHIVIPLPPDKLNSDLVSIIQRNTYNNDKMMIPIHTALNYLLVGVIISLIVGLLTIANHIFFA